MQLNGRPTLQEAGARRGKTVRGPAQGWPGDAGKLLRNPNTPKNVKDVAASDLAQTPHKPSMRSITARP